MTEKSDTWLEFLGYKIIHIDLDVEQSFKMIAVSGIEVGSEWEFATGVAQITRVDASCEYMYVVPVGMKARLVASPSLPERVDPPYVQIETQISGLFKLNLANGDELHTQEEHLKCQAPAILLPYLRATMASTLSIAGFGGLALPLVNIYQMAKENSPEIVDAEAQVASGEAQGPDTAPNADTP